MFLGKRSSYGVAGGSDMMRYSVKVQRLRVWDDISLAAGKMSTQLIAHLRLIAFGRLRLRHMSYLLSSDERNINWNRYYSYYSHGLTPRNMPKAEQVALLDEALGIYNNRVKICYCPILKSLFCIAVHQSCSTLPTVKMEN